MEKTMYRLLDKFIDWWRGWDGNDLASMLEKMGGEHKAGQIIIMTRRELRAYRACLETQYPPLLVR